MIDECVEVFEKMLDNDKNLMLDTYTLSQGIYVIVNKNGNIVSRTDTRKSKDDKEVDITIKDYKKLTFYDYNSRILDMNKAIDHDDKKIHSNNYLAFSVKIGSIVNNLLTEDIIDKYYDFLQNPSIKYTGKTKEIYDRFVEQEGIPDINKIETIRTWIKENIFNILDDFEIDNKDEGLYLKIFFEADLAEYERENRRYLYPKIYNQNKYTIFSDDVIYGVPNDNITLNEKKDFLKNLAKNNTTPYLLDIESTLLRNEFFKYLSNFIRQSKTNVYVDTTKNSITAYENTETPDYITSGYYLRIENKNGNAAIVDHNNIVNFNGNLKNSFVYKNYIGTKSLEDYRAYNNRIEICNLIDEIFFNSKLKKHFFSEPKEIKKVSSLMKTNIIKTRNIVFDWTYKGIDHGLEKVLKEVGLSFSVNSLINEQNEFVAIKQLNLLLSINEYFNKGGNNMGDILQSIKRNIEQKVLNEPEETPITTDDEYYYAVGQLVKYLSLKSESKNKHSFLKPIANTSNDKILKNKLYILYEKFEHAIDDSDKRVARLVSLVLSYTPSGKIQKDKVLLGYTSKNVIFTKREDIDNE